MSTLRIAVIATLGAAQIAAEASIELAAGDVVAFVGGTDMVRLQQDGVFEAALSEQFGAAEPAFRDLAWDGDTVYFQSTVRVRWRREAFGDWDAQLERVGATVVVAWFGKIESLDGPDKLGEFKTAYGKLIDEFAKGGRRVIILSPGEFEWSWAEDEALPVYTEAVEQLAKEKGLVFVPGNPLASVGDPLPATIAAVREKHRLWFEYWRPANWKCLFGDDARRIFSNAAHGLPSLKEEWSQYPGLIAAAEKSVRDREIHKTKPAPPRTGSGEADVAKELAAFDVLDGYEVNLFADESHGVANPLSVRWDADGRMFVACSDAYPQVEPGVKPDDKVIVLEDTDGDGAADSSAVFADGLNIPTGMEVGGDGVYVGGGTELLFFDWEGRRKLLLSGFGNGDSHQTSNGFAWSPDGDLWFCQGDGIESRVETPFGVSSLFQAGVYRLRPGELRLDPLLDDFMGPGNPWGVAFDDYGQSFVIDGAGGISYLTPGSVPVHRRLRLPRIGNPGGYCGVDALGDGSFGIGDYKKNQVARFRTPEDGAGFKVEFVEPLLRSKHRNFRPVDVKLGPDGAIYVVDWYNPITCHQDDFYRHPQRDKTHGRIWRVAKKGAAASGALTAASNERLIEELKSDNRWRRTKAKQVLATRELEALPAAMRGWEGRDLLEAVGLAVWCGLEDRPLLERLLSSEDHRCRAYGARIAGRWKFHDLLELAATDPHPRVRMEAVLACGQVPEARSVLVAAAAAERPRDRWIDYAFAQAVHHLKPHWVSAFRHGELDFGDRGKGLAAVLAQTDSKAVLAEIRDLLRGGGLGGDARANLARALLAIGGGEDLRLALDLEPPSAPVLAALAEIARPEFDVQPRLSAALKSEDMEVRAAAIRLAGSWRVDGLRETIRETAARPGLDRGLRGAAIEALGEFGGEESAAILGAIAHRPADPMQAEAIAALLRIEPKSGVRSAALALRRSHQGSAIREIFAAVVARDGAPALLAEELAKLELSQRQGDRLRMGWMATGLVAPKLAAYLDRVAGVSLAEIEFSDGLVGELVAAGRAGDRAKGEALYRSLRAGCAACHRVGTGGGEIGPDLSAVGSAVPAERIVTEVLWPARQVKEGFALKRYTLRDGKVLQGYEQPGRDERRVLVRDIASSEMHEIPAAAIARRDELGSLMPPTARALTREELADLLAYLFALRS